jgi:hypothetical protein
MPRFVITHVGTTAIECEAIKRRQNAPRDYERLERLILNNQQRTERLVEEWSEALQTGLRAIWNDPQRTERSDQFGRSPAEIASLYALDLQPGDQVVLFHSDTRAGEFCAELLRRCLVSASQANTGAETSDSNPRATLRQLLLDHFDISELQNLCFDLGIDFENLPGMGRADKARELIAYAERHGRLSELVAECRRLRPQIAWPDEAPPLGQKQNSAAQEDANSAFRPAGLVVAPLERLPGVEVSTGKNFVSDGLPSYMQSIAAVRQRMTGGDQLYFNVTGGYKGLVPFAVLAAQLLSTRPDPEERISTEIVYLAEETTELISLTAVLPTDWNKLKGIYPFIQILVDYAGSTRARAIVDEELQPFQDLKRPGYPNALALTVYHLGKDLGWFESS